MSVITNEEKMEIMTRLTTLELTMQSSFKRLNERFDEFIKSNDAIAKNVGQALDISFKAQSESSKNTEKLKEITRRLNYLYDKDLQMQGRFSTIKIARDYLPWAIALVATFLGLNNIS